MTDKLIPLTNLDSLSEADKREYLIQVCEYFGIPNHLNLLEYMKMDGGDGSLHTVLYAKKGATDMLRDKRGISVVELRDNITDSVAMFTAKGQDKTGRTEISVGVCSIKNLSGRELENKIMVAQTRAIRRMTLQFGGGGFLDESEVQQVTTSLNSTSQSISDLAGQSHPQPNASEPKLVRTPEQIAAQEALDRMTNKAEPPVKKLRRSKVVDFELDAPKGLKIEEADNIPCDAAVQPVIKGVVLPITPEPAPSYAELKPAVEAAVKPDLLTKPEPNNELEKVIETAEASLNLPSADEMKQFRARLLVFTEKTLPEAGMVPTEGLGGVTTKIRMFAMLRYRVNDIKKMSVDQWNDFLNDLESCDPAGLVAQIDKVVTGK